MALVDDGGLFPRRLLEVRAAPNTARPAGSTSPRTARTSNFTPRPGGGGGAYSARAGKSKPSAITVFIPVRSEQRANKAHSGSKAHHSAAEDDLDRPHEFSEEVKRRAQEIWNAPSPRLFPSLASVGKSAKFKDMVDQEAEAWAEAEKEEIMKSWLETPGLRAPPILPSSSLNMGTAAELLMENEQELRMQQGGSTLAPHLDSTLPSFHRSGSKVVVPVYNRGTLMESAPEWWHPSPAFVKSAKDYDKRHHKRSERAERLIASIRIDQTSISKATAFDETVFEVYSNRFVEPMEPLKLIVPKRRVASRKGFDLHETFWAPRAKWSDSKDFCDTPTVKRLKLNNDFGKALKSDQFAKFIAKHDDDGEVKEVFYQHHETYFMLFDFYAALAGDSFDELSLNEWTMFVTDCKLASNKSKFCKKADLDRLFIAVDGSSEAEEGGKNKALNRSEFLTCLMRLGVMKYVMTGQMRDVSDALSCLFTNDIEPHLDPMIFVSPDVFRREVLYTPIVVDALGKYEMSLKVLFGSLAKVGRGTGAKKLGLLLGLSTWKLVWRRLEMIDVDFTERDATLCFMQSRMAVIDSETDRGRLKANHLPFEGFLEAISRAAVRRSWPSDEEMKASNYTDAGAYILWLRKADPTRYQEMLAEKDDAVPIPYWRRIEHMATLIIRSVESKLSDQLGDMQLTPKEVKQWTAMWKQERESGIKT